MSASSPLWLKSLSKNTHSSTQSTKAKILTRETWRNSWEAGCPARPGRKRSPKPAHALGSKSKKSKGEWWVEWAKEQQPHVHKNTCLESLPTCIWNQASWGHVIQAWPAIDGFPYDYFIIFWLNGGKGQEAFPIQAARRSYQD